MLSSRAHVCPSTNLGDMAHTAPLHDLAACFGISAVTRDDAGQERPVPEAVLTGLLDRLGVPAGSDREIADSLQQLADEAVIRALPPSVVMRCGTAEGLPVHIREGADVRLEIRTEDEDTMPVESLGAPTDTRTVMVDGEAQLRQARTAVIPADLPTGYHALVLTEDSTTHSCPLIIAPESGASAATGPQERVWGLCADLYALRSHRSWGVGDFGDLSDLVVMAADKGADFIRLGPIHALPIREVSVTAAKARARGTPSPYAPYSRVAIDPIYLRIENIPETGHLPAAQREAVQSLGRGWGRPNAEAEPIPRAKVLADKLAALRILYSLPPTTTRHRLFADFCRQAPESLHRWALMSAAAAHYATHRHPDAWRNKLTHPDSDAAQEFAREHRSEVEFWLWTQFLAVEQLRQVQSAAAQVGMRIGLITDIAAGISVDGADWWAGRTGAQPQPDQDLCLDGIECRSGVTDSGDAVETPWNPRRLAADGYAAVRDIVRAAAAGAGAVCIEGLDRLGRQRWAVAGADEGAWAEVDLGAEAIRAVLDLESQRLGVEILPTTSVWEDEALRGRLADGSTPTRTIAVLTPPSHAPVASCLNLGDIAAAQQHAANRAAAQQLMSRARTARQEVLKTAAERGALAPTETMVGTLRESWPVVVGLHTYLGTLNASHLGAAVMDIVGQEALPHIAGAAGEYPNWSVVLQDSSGRAVLLEELEEHPGFAQIANTLNEQIAAGATVDRSTEATGREEEM